MGFGPLGPRAALVRPPSDVDTYGNLPTWFKNCSSPEAADGTVPTASFFNWWIAMWVYCAHETGITVANDEDDDTVIYRIISKMIEDQTAGYTQGIMSVI